MLIIAVGVLCYMNALDGDFIWDDRMFVVANPAIRDLANVPSFFSDPQTLAEGELAFENYRPLVTLSYALDYSIWRNNVFGYHFNNIMLHIINAILVFFLIKVLTGDGFISAATALIFTAHPVQVEAVTWISGRANVLFLLFYVASFLAYIRFRRSENRGKWYVVSLILFAMALLSKEMTATLPIMILLFEFLEGGKGRSLRRILPCLPFMILFLIYFAVRTAMLGKIGQMAYWGDSPVFVPLIIPQVLTAYAGICALPVGLCIDREFIPGMSAFSQEFYFDLTGNFFCGCQKAA